ncbi:MAG: hypothetical protein IT163_05745 [Bryobacterales bacterium]|nr:hypothetical protein [Bryobacterales bacterium]
MNRSPRDYRQIAAALATGIPAGELDGVVKPLEALEESFRPLTAALADETEPAFTLLLPTEWFT